MKVPHLLFPPLLDAAEGWIEWFRIGAPPSLPAKTTTWGRIKAAYR